MKPVHQIDVSVFSEYHEEQSDPDIQRYVFSYTVTMHNSGSVGARLQKRQWTITNADGEEQHVEGHGVVGETPHIKPGDTYEYTSGTILDTPFGTMQGHYQMHGDDGSNFLAEIPAFTLAQPHILH